MVVVAGSRRDDEASLEAAIIERVGGRVEVKDVLHGGQLVLVDVHLGEQDEDDFLTCKEWLHTELRALAAERGEGKVLAPHYVD